MSNTGQELTLQIEDFCTFKFLSQVRIAPDGRRVALLVKQANLERNDYDSHIWLYHLETGDLRQLTSAGNEKTFAWLNDSRHLLFTSSRQDDVDADGSPDETQVFQIPVDGGEAVLAFTLPAKVDEIRPLDDQQLLFLSEVDLTRSKPPEDESHQGYLDRKQKEEEETAYHVLDEIPFWSNGKSFTNKKRRHLFLHDRSTGETSDLTEGLFQVQHYDASQDRVIVAGRVYQDCAPQTNDLYLLDLADRSLTRLTSGELAFSQPRFLSEHLVAVAASTMQPFGLNQNEHLYLLDLTSGELTDQTPDMDLSLVNSVGTDSRLGAINPGRADAGRFFFHGTQNDSCYLYVFAPGQPPARLIDRPGAVDSFDVRAGRLVYVALRGNQLQELYEWRDGAEVQLTRLNEPALQDLPLSTPEPFAVTRDDGTIIDGWLMRPVGLEPGRRYPAILEIHGGPKTVSSHVYFHEYQVLASRGYAVYFCNPRGSDGKGDAFADIRGLYGTVDYEDIMAVVDHVLEHYDFVDPARLGVTGGSYGGFMTNWIIGHTGRFKAAVSQRSISSWLSFGYTTDIGYFFMPDQIGATPWQDADKLWFHSPLRYADRVTTPTLFINSAEDYRCWLPEGLQMFTALKYLGVESRMVIFDGENHELSRGGKPRHRIRRLQEIIAWFDSHL